MRYGFVSLLILLVFILGAAYLINSLIFSKPKNFSKTLQDASVTIPKYPSAQTWTFEPRRKICLIKSEPCEDTAVIDFTTTNQWSDVYHFYKDNLVNYGWATNSFVVLSLPTTILFQNRTGCEALLQQYSNPLQLSKQQVPQYRFNLSCISQQQK